MCVCTVHDTGRFSMRILLPYGYVDSLTWPVIELCIIFGRWEMDEWKTVLPVTCFNQSFTSSWHCGCENNSHSAPNFLIKSMGEGVPRTKLPFQGAYSKKTGKICLAGCFAGKLRDGNAAANFVLRAIHKTPCKAAANLQWAAIFTSPQVKPVNGLRKDPDTIDGQPTTASERFQRLLVSHVQ